MPAWRAADPGPSGLGTVPGMGEQISRADLEAAAEQLWEGFLRFLSCWVHGAVYPLDLHRGVERLGE